MMPSRNLMLSSFLLMGLVGAACSSSDVTSQGPTDNGAQMPGMSMSPGGSMSPGDGGSSPGGTLGSPGDPAKVDRIVRITQLDELRFEPAQVGIKAGETVKFIVANDGAVAHEFVLGDEAFQAAHEQEMVGMGGAMMPDEAGALSVDPNQKKTLVWTFPEAGTVLYGCHVAGHYVGGMKGQITVTP